MLHRITITIRYNVKIKYAPSAIELIAYIVTPNLYGFRIRHVFISGLQHVPMLDDP